MGAGVETIFGQKIYEPFCNLNVFRLQCFYEYFSGQKIGMADLREFTRELRAAADIAEVVGERVALQKRGANLFGLCPFHAEKTPSFSVNSAKGFYHCFGCGANGDALNFIIQTETGGDFLQGVESLARRLGRTMPRGGKESELSEKLGALLERARAHYCRVLEESPAALEYIKKRGLQNDAVARFEIGYAADGWENLPASMRENPALLEQAGLRRKKDSGGYDYFRNRLMFPITESGGRVIGFGGRALDNSEPKYLNSPDTPVFSKKRVVFGLPLAREAAREKKRVIVVEGYMDAVMLSQAGFAESVAVMGTALSPQQAQRIGRMADNIVLAFDGDDAGQNAAWRSLTGILPALKDGMGVSFLFLPEGEDPDSFVQKHGADSFETAIGRAASLGDYMAARLWKNTAGENTEARASAALAEGEKLIRLINANRAPFMREVLSRRLAEEAKITPESFHRAAARGGAKMGNKSRLKMNSESSVLYNFLCCLAARPSLIKSIAENSPLPGNEIESEIAAAVIHYLRRHPGADGEEGEADVAAYLHGEGYETLARQVRGTARLRYVAGDPEADFLLLAKRLADEHEKRTGARRQKFLAQIPAMREPGD